MTYTRWAKTATHHTNAVIQDEAKWFFMATLCSRCEHYIFTGMQHCAHRKPLVFNLLRGRFWGISPHRGDTLHR